MLTLLTLNHPKPYYSFIAIVAWIPGALSLFSQIQQCIHFHHWVWRGTHGTNNTNDSHCHLWREFQSFDSNLEKGESCAHYQGNVSAFRVAIFGVLLVGTVAWRILCVCCVRYKRIHSSSTAYIIIVTNICAIHRTLDSFIGPWGRKRSCAIHCTLCCLPWEHGHSSIDVSRTKKKVCDNTFLIRIPSMPHEHGLEFHSCRRGEIKEGGAIAMHVCINCDGLVCARQRRI
jgi:hypothetical protein